MGTTEIQMKDHKKLLQATICQKNGQPRRNVQIFREVISQDLNIKNRKYKDTNHKYWNWYCDSQQTKLKNQLASQANSIKHLQKSEYLSFWNSSKIAGERTLPISSYEATITITLTPKPNKHVTKKKIIGKYHWWTYMQKSSNKY